MQFAFLLYDDENAMESLSAAEFETLIGKYMGYSKEMQDAGVMVAGEPLEHSRGAKKLRGNPTAPTVEDGPFTETKEQLGGFYIVDVNDLDAALDWAAKCPSAESGVVEVRPIWNPQ